MLLLAPFWLEGLPRDQEGAQMALGGPYTELGGHQMELRELLPKLGGSQWELGVWEALKGSWEVLQGT